MKLSRLLLAGAGFGLVALSACDKIPGSQPKLTTAKDSLSYAIGVSIGRGMKSQGVDSLVNADMLQQTVASAIKGDSMQMTDAQANQFIQQYFSTLQTKKVSANLEAGKKFLEANKQKSGIQTTSSGLQYQVLKEGTGAQPKATDSVTVHYVGTLTNGKEFDSSVKRGEPATFVLNQVIPGWTEGVQLMKEGGKNRFFVPSELGYGPQGSPPVIEPNSVLVFEVELLKVAKGGAAPAGGPGSGPANPGGR
jgi:FKBP-type peptidyl-prolyl cis-trans isomerase